METKIYNIDSSIVTSKTSSNNFTYNSMNSVIGNVRTIEPFNEKNVIEINILSIELPSISGDNVGLELPSGNTYFFLRINDFGNIINRNRRYVAKIKQNEIYTTLRSFNLITNRIKLDQPIDIKELQISLENENDTVSQYVNMNGTDFSFSFELTTISNSILKNSTQVRFYSVPVMERMLQAKMLAYFEKKIDAKENTSLTGVYNKNLVNYNNTAEYTPNGNRENYNMIEPSYFKNND